MITVPILTADLPDTSGNIYTIEVLQAIVQQCKDKSIVGMIEMPNHVFASADKVSHEVNNIRLEGNTLYGDVTAFTNANGKIAQELLTEGRAVVKPVGFAGEIVALEGKRRRVQGRYQLCGLNVIRVGNPHTDDKVAA